MIFRLLHAANVLKGMCGNEPDKRDPAMIRNWAAVEMTLRDAEMYIRSMPAEEQTLPCDDCGEDVPVDEFCGNDRSDGSTEYLCPDCYEPDT
jgi:hypothetical protein